MRRWLSALAVAAVIVCGVLVALTVFAASDEVSGVGQDHLIFGHHIPPHTHTLNAKDVTVAKQDSHDDIQLPVQKSGHALRSHRYSDVLAGLPERTAAAEIVDGTDFVLIKKYLVLVRVLFREFDVTFNAQLKSGGLPHIYHLKSEYWFPLIVELKHPARFDVHVRAQLTLHRLFGNFILSQHSFGGGASILNSFQRSIKGALDVPNAYPRKNERYQAENRGREGAGRGALLCLQILLIVTCLVGGFYLFIDTFEKSRRIAPNAGALRIFISCCLICGGGLLSIIFFAGL